MGQKLSAGCARGAGPQAEIRDAGDAPQQFQPITRDMKLYKDHEGAEEELVEESKDTTPTPLPPDPEAAAAVAMAPFAMLPPLHFVKKGGADSNAPMQYSQTLIAGA